MTTQTVTKLKIVQLKNSNGSKLKSDKTKTNKMQHYKKIKMWQNTISQIVTKLKNSNWDYTQTWMLPKLEDLNCDKNNTLYLWTN